MEQSSRASRVVLPKETLIDIKLKISDGSGAQLKSCYLFVKVLAKIWGEILPSYY
jgi:hypothetical protein